MNIELSDTSPGLNGTDDVVVSAFKEKTIQHKKLLTCYERLTSEILLPGGEQIIFVFGPSGVGKTTLIRGTIRYLKRIYLRQCEQEPWFVPFTFVEASAQSGVFDWKDHWQRFLECVDEPLIDKKKPVNNHGFNEREIREGVRRSTPTNDLRRAAERFVANRGTIANFIDEAQHLKRTGRSAKALSDQLDTLKSFANLSNSKVILVGTYELLDFLKLSGQLSRRSAEIHFPRYYWENDDDRLHFAQAVHTLQKWMPYSGEARFVDDLRLFYKYSLGCVGILKDWMTRSLRRSREKKMELVTMDIIKECAMSESRLASVLQEMKEGENRYTMDPAFDLDVMLGFGAPSKIIKPAQKGEQRKASHPGKRLPTRDPVGDNNV